LLGQADGGVVGGGVGMAGGGLLGSSLPAVTCATSWSLLDEFVAADTIQALFLDVVDRLRKHNEHKGKADANSQRLHCKCNRIEAGALKLVAMGIRALAARCSSLSSLCVARSGLLSLIQ
jgi:hypothetical protein